MASVVRNIELRPHTGIDRAGRLVTFAQDQIFLNGVRVGYVGHSPGETICLIRPADEGTVAEIKRAIAAKHAGPDRSVKTAPVIEEAGDE